MPLQDPLGGEPVLPCHGQQLVARSQDVVLQVSLDVERGVRVPHQTLEVGMDHRRLDQPGRSETVPRGQDVTCEEEDTP